MSRALLPVQGWLVHLDGTPPAACSDAKHWHGDVQDSMEPQNDTHMQSAALTCRAAMVTAAALASEEAASIFAQEAASGGVDVGNAALADADNSLPAASSHWQEGLSLPALEQQSSRLEAGKNCCLRVGVHAARQKSVRVSGPDASCTCRQQIVGGHPSMPLPSLLSRTWRDAWKAMAG